MARGEKFKKRQKNKNAKNKTLKFKKKKKRTSTFRDIKHTDQYAQYKLKVENEKKKKVEIVDSESENDEVQNDPFSLLLSTFGKNKNKVQENSAIDSDDSSNESEEKMEVENGLSLEGNIIKNNEDESVLNEKFKSKSVDERSKKNNNDNVDDDDDDDDDYDYDYDDNENYNEIDEESEIELEDTKLIEAEVNNRNDPFFVHFNFDLSDNLLESVSMTSVNTKSFKLYWPTLHNLKVEIPTASEKEKSQSIDLPAIKDDLEYAKEGVPPTLIKSVDFEKLYIKNQIMKNIHKTNKKFALVHEDFTSLQKELFSIINNYQDLYYNERKMNNGEEIRFLYCLHTVNHILKTRLKILHHNSKLSKTLKEITPDEYRDQGLVRPKVFIIVPFRDSCLRIVEIICSILLSEAKSNIINKKRFYNEFRGSELIFPKKNPKPEDYEQLFTGNIDDNFRIGLSFTKKSVKLYSDFYASDVIIASPLGLRMVIGAEGDKDRDFDFLASAEVLILDQAEVFLMQNWDHLLIIFEHLHIQPKESHGTDFSRVRSWALNGWTKFYRQTLIFSSIVSSELNSIFNRRCFNYAGKILTINPVEDGSICKVLLPLSHVFQKFHSSSAIKSVDDRFQLFTEKVIPQYKDPILTGVLLYVPSYFDYVRIRNYLKQSDYNFVQICEYTKDAKVARARDMFFHNEARILLYSERFHFFRRITLKGIKHVIFYQPPTLPHFYSEICNLMQEGNQNRFLSNDTMMTVTVLYCKYDVHQLAGIVKTTRASKMISSERDVHMFSTG